MTKVTRFRDEEVDYYVSREFDNTDVSIELSKQGGVILYGEPCIIEGQPSMPGNITQLLDCEDKQTPFFDDYLERLKDVESREALTIRRRHWGLC